MRKTSILPDIDLQNSMEYYGMYNSRDFYKGTSFKMSGEWSANTHYFNDEYIIDFVSWDGSLWACQRSHLSSVGNEPNVNSRFWTEVITGVEGKAYVPSLDDDGNLIFSLDGNPPTEPIDLASFKGEPGKDGKDGKDGTDGSSAYEIAKEQDPSIGTEEEWIKSLQGLTYKPIKIENNLLYFQADNGQTITVSTENIKGDKGDKGDTGADGYTPSFIESVIIYELSYGSDASARLIPIRQEDNHYDYQLELKLPEGKPGKTGAKGDKGDKGDQGVAGPTPHFKLVRNDELKSTELYFALGDSQSWENLGEVGGKSPKLIRVLSTVENPDTQDNTRRNDRILWGYDGIPVSEWTTLCYLDDLRGDENIWVGCEEPKMLDGVTPDHSKIWYDPCDEAIDKFSTTDFIYQSYLDSGGNLPKDEFIAAFSSINKTSGFEVKFAKSFEDLGEPNDEKSGILWLIPNDISETNNNYIEYIVVYNEETKIYSWEQWGTQSINIDLKNYYTKDEVDSLLEEVSSTVWTKLI